MASCQSRNVLVPAVVDTPVLAENLGGIPLTLETAGGNAGKQKCIRERKQREERSNNAESLFTCACHLQSPLVVTLS